MKPLEALAAINQQLRNRVSSPVRTSGMEGERPVPAIILDDWELEEMNFHNSAYVGRTTNIDADGDGLDELAYWYRFYYDMRIDLIARDSDDVSAHVLLGEVQDAIRQFQIDPSILHEHINTVTPGTAGRMSYQFNEPKETELTYTVTLQSFHQVSKTDFDTIQDVKDTFTTQ